MHPDLSQHHFVCQHHTCVKKQVSASSWLDFNSGTAVEKPVVSTHRHMSSDFDWILDELSILVYLITCKYIEEASFSTLFQCFLLNNQDKRQILDQCIYFVSIHLLYFNLFRQGFLWILIFQYPRMFNNHVLSNSHHINRGSFRINIIDYDPKFFCFTEKCSLPCFS